MNSMSIVQTERLFASHASLFETRARCEALKGEHAEAKKRMNEARESLLSSVSGAREKHQAKSTAIGHDEAEAIWKHEKEYTRSIKAFEVIDREKRRTDDLEKKLTERVLSIIEDAKKGDELPFEGQKPDAASPDSRWSEILLADLIGDLTARPFIQFVEVHTLGQFVEKWKGGGIERAARSREIEQKLIDYAGAKVRDYLLGRDLASKLAPGMKDLPPASLKHVSDIKEEKPAKAEKGKDATPAIQVLKPDGSIDQDATDAAIKAKFDETAMPTMFATGEDEHLNAAVAELGLDEKTTLAITSAGFTTIQEIIGITEKHAGVASVIGINTGWKPGQIRTILAAVAEYRKKHAKAARDAEAPPPLRIAGVRDMGTPKAKARVGKGAGKKGRR